MNILLINVSIIKSIESMGYAKQKTNSSFPSLGLTLLTSLTPEKHTVQYIEDSNEDIVFSKDYDLVGLSFYTPAAVRAYDIADRFHELGVKVVMGGVHASALPYEALEHADVVAIGEAELIWPEILNDAENNSLKQIYQQDHYIDMSDIPQPARHILNKKKYITTNVIQATRGCPLDCEFCSVKGMFGKKIRYQPVQKVIEDIKSMDNNIIVFTDDNIAINKKYTKELLTEMIPLKRKWIGEASWTIGKDEEILGLAKKSGCKALLIGFESIRPQTNVKKVSKEDDMKQLYLESIRNLRKHGIVILGAFIFGFDNDDNNTFDESLAFIKKSGIELVQISSLTPFPGTSLYDRHLHDNRIITNDWRKYTYDPPGHCMEPKLISSGELKTGIKKIYKKFYSRKRLPIIFFKVLLSSKSIVTALYCLVVFFSFRKNVSYGYD